ncbi:hypothetical protein BC831DRAFT_473257 [Entophlyctis helioformis]|nr:hypothetical protein BC831DRAFT_473257 [Entophlyctis helioformis]
MTSHWTASCQQPYQKHQPDPDMDAIYAYSDASPSRSMSRSPSPAAFAATSQATLGRLPSQNGPGPASHASQLAHASPAAGNPPSPVRRRNITPQQLGEFVHLNPLSAVPPYEHRPHEINSRVRSLSVRVVTARGLFVTGGSVEGRLEITCTKEHELCRIGKIQVYLVGIEETLPVKAKQPNQRLFLSKRLTLQDASILSDAVYGGNPDEHGMRKAWKRTTSFDFSIPFGNDASTAKVQRNDALVTEVDVDGPLPSSYWSKQSGGIRYMVAGVAYTKHRVEPNKPIAAYRDLLVVESAPFGLKPEFATMLPPTSPLTAEISEKVKRNLFNIGKKGTIKLSASIRVPEVDTYYDTGVWTSGNIGFVGVDIKNGSTREIQELSISLIRRVKTFKHGKSATDFGKRSSTNSVDEDTCSLTPLSFTRDVVSKRTLLAGRTPKRSGNSALAARFLGGGFAQEDYVDGHDRCGEKGHETWHGVPANDYLSLLLDVHIPIHARSVRFGLLVDVSFVVQVSIKPQGSPSIEVEIPVTILHPASVLVNLPPIKLNLVQLESQAPAEVALSTETLPGNHDDHQAGHNNYEASYQQQQQYQQYDSQYAAQATRQDDASYTHSQQANDASPIALPHDRQLHKDDTFVQPSTRQSMIMATSHNHGHYDTMKPERTHLREDLIKSKYNTVGRTAVSLLAGVNVPATTTTSRSGTLNSKRDSDPLSTMYIPPPPTMPPMLSIKQQAMASRAATVNHESAPVHAPTQRSAPPASLQQTVSLADRSGLAAPPPPPPPPPPLPANLSAMRIPSNDLGSAESLEGVPRMDLVQEIDKLFACVQVE